MNKNNKCSLFIFNYIYFVLSRTFNNNKFSGTIPSELGNLSNLEYL